MKTCSNEVVSKDSAVSILIECAHEIASNPLYVDEITQKYIDKLTEESYWVEEELR